MSRPSKRLNERSEAYSRRREEAVELGLWPEVRNADEADRRRAELARLGFADWDSDAWEQVVETLRAANADRRGPEPEEPDPSHEDEGSASPPHA